jgi:hypothetical protein
MKRLIIVINFSLFCLATLLSCSKDDTYTSLSPEAKALLFYEVGDTFQLKNIDTDEIITLTVNWKNFDYYRETYPGIWFAGSGGDDYYEYGQYNFTDETNCHNGNINVEARSNGTFKLTAYVGECFENINGSFEYQDEFFTSVEVNGIEYLDVYLIKSFAQTIFYSKENGIIKIVDDFSQETQFIIAE